MQIFFHVARGHGSFPRGRLLCAPRYPRRLSYRRQFYRRLVVIGCWQRRMEGVSTRWCCSRSAGDGDAWRAGARDGVGRDRQRTATRGGLVLAMESLATSIGCGRQRVEDRGVSVAIGWAYMARREVRIARGTGRRVRLGFFQTVRGLEIMPSLLSHLPNYPKCKLQMQNCFGKL